MVYGILINIILNYPCGQILMVKNIKKTISRINKLDLSETAENILLNTLFSYAYAPKNLSEKEFLDIKINWLIKNKKDDLIEQFLKKIMTFQIKIKLFNI